MSIADRLWPVFAVINALGWALTQRALIRERRRRHPEEVKA